MTEEGLAKPSEAVSNESKQQRKRRKWDQPAESFISAGLAVPGGVPLGMGSLVGIALPIVAPFSASFPPKIQDELIAREIVINDAEATVRYKLTRRQTQEEIQKSTGAVVITRGKYQPPNAATDTERPLYLHISAGANLKDTSERIKAVDRAASMIEEILKSGSLPASTTTHILLNTGQVTQPLSSSVFLGFDPNPTLNIVARIRGPNDQYINHIMNETGATVLLRGRGSRNPEGTSGEEAQQPLHLYLSASNPKSLEDARILAENLLDTICTECGASRLSSCKAYGAVPPPQQLLVGAPNSSGEPEVAGSSSSAGGSSSIMPSFTTTVPPVSSASSAVLYPPGSAISYGQSQSHTLTYSRPLVPGTCYSGYGGIYPQATPLQQVALALRQAPTQTASVVSPAVSTSTALPKNSSSTIRQMDKQPPQKRKFQEQPIAPKGPAKINQFD
ncbi:Protein RIK [Acorus calamus]|uniref:Protein RIK n=1 Tax=Acorus calamus TaxID=4465 RepID=A0AAV9D3J4_ACOCL|nr:Protein RIK [Acorus calamus]